MLASSVGIRCPCYNCGRWVWSRSGYEQPPAQACYGFALPPLPLMGFSETGGLESQVHAASPSAQRRWVDVNVRPRP
jgi:hypothetical protein